MQSIEGKKGISSPQPGEGSVTPVEPNLWVHLHVLSQHWLSDLEFYEDELNFFRILIDKHLELLIDQKNIAHTRTMISHVQNLETRRAEAEQKIRKHLTHISALIVNPFTQNAQNFKEEHERLESDFLEFVVQYRNVKREVFKLTEQVIASGKINKLIERR
jgi:hypothetical protein